MPKKRNLRSQSALKNADWPLSEEETFALMLDTQRQCFQADKTNSLPAFHAMACLLSYIWRKDENTPDRVSVPYWVVEVIGKGFMRYMDSAASGQTVGFGQAMQIEGGGQGKPPRIVQYLKEVGDMRIAQQIAVAKQAGVKVEAAVQDAADAYNLNHQTIRDIWSRLAGHAQKQLRRLRAAIEQQRMTGDPQHRAVATKPRPTRRTTS